MYKVDWGNPPEEPSPEVLEAMRVEANELAKRIIEQINLKIMREYNGGPILRY